MPVVLFDKILHSLCEMTLVYHGLLLTEWLAHQISVIEYHEQIYCIVSFENITVCKPTYLSFACVSCNMSLDYK